MNIAHSKKQNILLVEPRVFRSRKIMNAVLADPGSEFLGCALNLTQAYDLTERECPDVVLIAREIAEQSSFAMFQDLMRVLGIRHEVLPDNPDEYSPSGPRNNTSSIPKGPPRGTIDLPPLRQPPERRSEAASTMHQVGLSRKTNASGRWKTVVIGASTGGVEALLEVLSHFPADGPPVLVVQHISANFLGALTERLDRNLSLRVTEARDQAPIQPGQVLMAPGDSQHLTISPSGQNCRLVTAPPVSGHRPSVDMLFSSAARLGEGVVAVILTGMGQDGAQGLAEIRRAGGHTIGQDRATSTVFGMPRAAAELGGVKETLPLGQIGPAILASAERVSERSSDVSK